MAVPHRAERDLYQVLGVDRDALRGDIAQAYRRKARAVHPDSRPVAPDALNDFRVLTEAYRVLSDPARRAAYDRTLGSRTASRVAAGPPPVRAPGPPLWAGPVRVEGQGPVQVPGVPDWVRLAAAAELAAWYLGEDWPW